MGFLKDAAARSAIGQLIQNKKNKDIPGFGLVPAVYNALQKNATKKSGAKGMPSMPGQSPLGMSQNGNVSGSVTAVRGGSPLGSVGQLQ